MDSQVCSASANICGSDLTITTTKHTIKASTVNDSLDAISCCCITSAKYTTNSIVARVYMNNSTFGCSASLTFKNWTIVCQITTTEYLVNGISGIVLGIGCSIFGVMGSSIYIDSYSALRRTVSVVTAID